MKSSDRDCGCVDHTGPHWMHMDKLWYSRNQVLLAVLRDETKPYHDRELAYFAFCQGEQLRLTEKLAHMQISDFIEVAK